ncbi:hypothetical protein QBC41DRAFT_133575 [Cercophora samala]|uniref:Uncharacterized protein n=1 Tax=Cercophora samala TaxID=330535 RepID=A0AA39ZCA6_9PEZI|nr:hypothetical protein QBC41DRAFT_133575 [Cercophora samala]
MAPGSRSSSRLSQPLPMIIEDVVHSTTPPPGVPPKSPRRPPVSRSNSQNSMHSSHRSRTPPPPFGVGPGGGVGVRPASISSTTAAGTTKAEVTQREMVGGEQRRDQGPVARKGWYRKMFGSLLVVGVIVGLSVGLTIGLRKRNQNSQSSASDTAKLFPSGSYTFTTALLPNTSTSCLTLSSFSAAWQCYTSSSSSTSPTQQPSTSIFHWTISPSTPRSGYTISSSSSSSSSSSRISNNSNNNNSSEPQFQNLTLTHLDINQYTERFLFSLIYPKPVTLSIPITNNGTGEERIKCWFNTTVLSAAVYTRQRAAWPEEVGKVNMTEITGRAGEEGEERRWPFLVEVSERQQLGGEEGGVMPDCYWGNGTGVDLGMLVLLLGGGGSNGTTGGQGECGCWYRNFELDGPRGNGTVSEKLRGG